MQLCNYTYCIVIRDVGMQQADVLVNVISSKTQDLSVAGAVSAAFLDAAGDQLYDVRVSVYF